MDHVRISLTRNDSNIYSGIIYFRNYLRENSSKWKNYKRSDKEYQSNDPTGATYYLIAVVLVYGMSIVLLIASHIKRKHSKVLEDRQIIKYLEEFQIVRETSSKETYRSLKRNINEKLVDRTPRGLTNMLHVTAMAPTENDCENIKTNICITSVQRS